MKKFILLMFCLGLTGCASMQPASKSVVLIENPSTAKDYYARGVYYSGKFNRSKAISELDRAVSIDPDYLDAYLLRSQCYAFIDVDRAIADLDQAIRLSGGNATFYSTRGEYYFHKGDYASAIPDYSEAIRLQPGDWQLYNSRAMFYAQAGKVNEAIKDLDKVNSLRPDLGFAYLVKSGLLARSGRIDEAIRSCKIAQSRIGKNKSDMLSGFILGGVVGAWLLYEVGGTYSPDQKKMLAEQIRALEKMKKQGTAVADTQVKGSPVIGMSVPEAINIIYRNEKVIREEEFCLVSIDDPRDNNDGTLNVYVAEDGKISSIKKIPLKEITALPEVSFPSPDDVVYQGRFFGLPKEEFLALARESNLIVFDKDDAVLAVGWDGAANAIQLKRFYFEKGKFLSRGYVFQKIIKK